MIKAALTCGRGGKSWKSLFSGLGMQVMIIDGVVDQDWKVTNRQLKKRGGEKRRELGIRRL